MEEHYEFCVQGHLDPDWSEWFDDFMLTHRPDGVTVLVGPVVDQAALHSQLNKIRDLGLVLISVNRVSTNKVKAIGKAKR